MTKAQIKAFIPSNSESVIKVTDTSKITPRSWPGYSLSMERPRPTQSSPLTKKREGRIQSGTTHNDVQKVLASFQSKNTRLATQIRECQVEVAIIKFEKTDAIKNATKWKSSVSQLQMEGENLQHQNIKLQQRNTFEAAFQSAHIDDCLSELDNVNITTDNNRLLEDTNSLGLNDVHLSKYSDLLGPPLPPPLPAEAATKEGEETKIDEWTNTLDSLNEFENSLMLGLEDDHEHS